MCATDILYLSLWSSFHCSLCYRHSVRVIKELLPQLSVILTFCTYHYGSRSTAFCAINILYALLWTSFHFSVFQCHSVLVVKNLLPHLYELLTFWNCHYESNSPALCAPDILYLSLWSSIHSFVCYWYSVPVIMKLLPSLSLILTFCTCLYEVTSTALCDTDILYLSFWSSFQSLICYWHSVHFIIKLQP